MREASLPTRQTGIGGTVEVGQARLTDEVRQG